jgi:hypothetical protein
MKLCVARDVVARIASCAQAVEARKKSCVVVIQPGTHYTSTIAQII